MSTVDLIREKAKTLRSDYQEELLRYLDYLVQRQDELEASREWTEFSASQLAEQYAPSDEIYDKES